MEATLERWPSERMDVEDECGVEVKGSAKSSDGRGLASRSAGGGGGGGPCAGVLAAWKDRWLPPKASWMEGRDCGGVGLAGCDDDDETVGRRLERSRKPMDGKASLDGHSLERAEPILVL